MISIDGKQVFTDVAEIVDPRHTALLIVDMQRDFVELGGAFADLGVDVGVYSSMRPRLAALLQAARTAGVLVAHVQMGALPDRRSDSPAQLRFNMRMHQSFHGRQEPIRYTEVGSWGHQFVDEMTPLPDELVVPKWRSSAFWGTSLDLLLRSNGIQSVVVTGCTTEGCVESTARDALFNDYYVVVPEDCVGSDDPAQHEASLLLMRHRFDVVVSEQVLDGWMSASVLRETGTPVLEGTGT